MMLIEVISTSSLLKLIAQSQGKFILNTSAANSPRSIYSLSSPCDHLRKRPAPVTNTFVKPSLNYDLIFVTKSSRKRQ